MSKYKVKTNAYVNKGKLHIYDRSIFESEIAKMTDCEVSVIVEKQLSNISHNQRKYFFGVLAVHVRKALKELGNEYSQKDVNDFLYDSFLYEEKYNSISGRVIKYRLSMSDSAKEMPKPLFDEIKMKIQRWAQETLNYEIPDPDPSLKLGA